MRIHVGAYGTCSITGYLACARCSNTGSLVLIEPVSTFNGGNQPLSPPKTERCSNCSGSGKVCAQGFRFYIVYSLFSCKQYFPYLSAIRRGTWND